jgi:RNA-directed DNA polymerase
MIRTLPNLYQFLRLTESEVKFITDNIGNCYKAKNQAKRKYGEDQVDRLTKQVKERHLMVPIEHLKQVQRRIVCLLEGIELPYYMYGSVKGKNNIENALQHVDQQFFLTVDLKSFFPNIRHVQVFAMFCANGFSPSVSRVLTQLTTFQGSLPQGSPSSPIISNLIFRETGDKLADIAQNNYLKFTTFLDDLTFSSQTGFKQIIQQILKTVSQDRFCIAYDKIHYRVGYSEVTGIFVKGNTITIPHKMFRKARFNPCLNDYRCLVEAYNNQIVVSQRRKAGIF